MPFAINSFRPEAPVKIFYETMGFPEKYLITKDFVPILFLHGIFGRGSDWTQMGFGHLIKERFGLIFMDLRGHGKSTKCYEPSDYFPNHHATDILSVLDDLGIEKSIVWGYSFGGRMAFAFGLRFPERVIQIIVGGMHPYKVENVYDAILQRQSVIKHGMANWIKYLDERDIPVSEYTRDVLLSNDHKALVATDDSILQWSGFEDLLKLCTSSFSILLYLGSRDKSYISLAHQFEKECSSATLLLIKDLNHFTAFSDADKVLKDVIPFLHR